MVLTSRNGFPRMDLSRSRFFIRDLSIAKSIVRDRGGICLRRCREEVRLIQRRSAAMWKRCRERSPSILSARPARDELHFETARSAVFTKGVVLE